MEEDKKPKTDPASSDGHDFKTSDILQSKASQRDQLIKNVYEPWGTRARKKTQKFLLPKSDWIFAHRQLLFIVIVSVVVLAVVTAIIVGVIANQPAQESSEQGQEVALETDPNAPADSPFTDPINEAYRLYANDPNNTNKVVDYFQNFIRTAANKGDSGNAYTYTVLMIDFFVHRNAPRAAIDAANAVRQESQDTALKDYCTYRINNLAKEIGDQVLIEENNSKYSDPTMSQSFEAQDRNIEEMRHSKGGGT